MLHALVLLGVVGGTVPGTPLLHSSIAASALEEPTAPPRGAAAGSPEAPVHDTLVVTATLVAQPEAETPAAVAVITREEILARQTETAADLLRTVAGVDVVRSGAAGKATSLFVRGQGSNQTLVLWNGVQLNDPFFGGFDWAFLPTDGLDRLEVVRSPVSVLYGSDAAGGVVQLLSGHRAGARVRSEGGSDGYGRASFDGGLDRGALRLDVVGHLRRGDGELDNDGYDGEEVMARGDWSLGDSASMGLVVRSASADVGLPRDAFGAPSPRRLQERDTTQVAVPVRWTTGAWEVRGQLSRQALDLSVSDPDDPFGDSASEAEALQARTVATRRFDGGWAAFGVDWERQEATSRSSFGNGLAGDRQRTSSGFGEVHVDRGSWVLDLGLRRDDNDAFGVETTGRVGAHRRFGDHRLRAAWGQGFRAPSLGDLFFPGFGNPDLRPEISDTLEVGWSWSAMGWSVAATAFETDVEDLIVFDFATNLPQNVGRARSRGIEAETAWRGDRFWGRLAATWLDAEDRDTGEALVRRPDWRGSLVGGWRREARSVTATLRRVGERTDLGGVPLDGYTTFDLAASWQARPAIAPYARVENLFDERYEEAAGFPGPDRAVVAGLAVAWGES